MQLLMQNRSRIHMQTSKSNRCNLWPHCAAKIQCITTGSKFFCWLKSVLALLFCQVLKFPVFLFAFAFIMPVFLPPFAFVLPILLAPFTCILPPFAFVLPILLALFTCVLPSFLFSLSSWTALVFVLTSLQPATRVPKTRTNH